MRRNQAKESGQTLLVSIVVLFLLIFIGTIFVVMVTRSLGRAALGTKMTKAQYFAEAGLRFVDSQLVYGEMGADWRPPLTDQAGLLPDDPDYNWLKDPDPNDSTPAFTRYTYEDGRFLVRVTYDPVPPTDAELDPLRPPDASDLEWEAMKRDIRLLRQCLKIEIVGREGVVDPSDPTTFTAQADRSRFEIIAYKPIGLLENAWFITNKDKARRSMRLGVSGTIPDERDPGRPFPTRLSGSIRVNGDLEWEGDVRIELDPWFGGNPNVSAYDKVMVAGQIRHDENAQVILRLGNTDYNLYPSDDTQFDTYEGRYLDAYAPFQGRKVKRLEPPLIDAVDPSTGQVRFLTATRDSGEWRTYAHDTASHRAGEWYNTGWYAWGEGVYIDNTGDKQPETPLFSLPSEWTTPGGNQETWVGYQYVPPGVEIIIYPRDLGDEARQYPGNDPTIADIRLVRHDGKSFYLPDGETPIGSSVLVDYPKNGVILAEGNVRVRGTVGRPGDSDGNGWPLTIVSLRTAYIEGSILKERDPNTGLPDPRTGVAILAHDYVCVNTTRFVRMDSESLITSSQFVNTIPPYEIVPGDVRQPSFAFEFGSTPDPNLSIYLLTEHSCASIPFGFGDVLALGYCINQYAPPNYQFPETSGSYLYFNDPLTQIYPNWRQQVFPINPAQGSYTLDLLAGGTNTFYYALAGGSNYLLERVAIEPMEYRIEAVLYAQEKSFFVIPGYWHNNNRNDTWANLQSKGHRPEQVSPDGSPVVFPFYREPLDILITIDGAVIESGSASPGDAADWMSKWGWTPDEYGDAGQKTVFGQTNWAAGYGDKDHGIRVVYDCASLRPLDRQTVRRAPDGQLLPPFPRLPVSPDILYAPR
jgi:hypothetical protein